MGACGGRSALELPSPDAGQGTDAVASDDAASVVDTGTDAGIDGEPPSDSALDASSLDSSFDGPIVDGGPEVSTDAALDAPTDAPVLAAPRPIAPLSTSTATSQQPTLRWQLDPGSDGAQVEICGDRACTTIVATFTAPGTSARVPSALHVGVYFWRLHGTASGVVRPGVSPTWELFVGARSSPVDTSWGSAPDIDSDGFADGFTALDSSNYNGAGVVLTYHGSTKGLTTWTAFGPPSSTPSVFFGVKTAMAGDIDGDGYPELLVSDQYRVWLYPGGASGLVDDPTLIFDDTALVIGLVGLGDANGDGYADVGLGIVTNTTHAVLVYQGGPGGLSAPTTLSVPGFAAQGFYPIGTDINGDGYGDLVEEGCLPGPTDCQAYFFAGGPAGFPSTPVAAQPVAGQWTGVTFGGDVNGDGYADLLDAVTDPSTPDASTTAVIRVFPGGPAGVGAPVLFARPSAGGVTYTGTLFTTGDIDGDGFADVGVGVGGGSGQGDVWVYPGSATLGVQVYGKSDVYNPGPKAALTIFSAAGDVNGDGYGDVLGGDWQVTSSAYLFLGGKNGVDLAPDNAILEGGDSVL